MNSAFITSLQGSDPSVRKRSKLLIAVATFTLLLVAGSVLAAPDIRVVVDGKHVSMPLVPQMIGDRVVAPVRFIAEALGAKVSWNPDQRVVFIHSAGINAMKQRAELLERLIEGVTPEQTAKTYAEAVRTRNGAAQYAMLSPELKKQKYESYESMNWVTGVSSPWVESYEVVSASRLQSGAYRYEVKYNYMASTGPAGNATEVLFVSTHQDRYFIFEIGK